MIDWLKGKKTYFVAAIVALVALCRYFGVEIPDYVWALLAAVGLGSLRAGVQKGE